MAVAYFAPNKRERLFSVAGRNLNKSKIRLSVATELNGENDEKNASVLALVRSPGNVPK